MRGGEGVLIVGCAPRVKRGNKRGEREGGEKGREKTNGA